MIKRIAKWIIKMLDIAVGVEDGIVTVSLWLGNILLLEHEFDLNTLIGASTSAIARGENTRGKKT